MLMSRIFRPLLQPLAGVSLLALSTVAAHADDCASPVVLGDKPSMSSYGDYEDFLVAVMEHKAKEEEKNKHQKMCPQLYQEAPMIAEQAETLNDAVQRSAQQEPFDYSRNQRWYNRSTSQSFALSGLPNSSMSGETIHTSLSGLEEDGPLTSGQRNILLALQGPFNGIDDGADASTVSGQLASDTQIIREREVQAAFGFDSFLNRLKGVAFLGGGSGSLVLYQGDENFIFAEGLVEVENCLGSCGQLNLTINAR